MIRQFGIMNRGLAYHNNEKYRQAVLDFDMAIKLDPKLAVAYVYRGGANFKAGNVDQAIVDYERAIAVNPKEAMAYYSLARIYSLKENKEKATQDLEKAIQINPNIKDMAKSDRDLDNIRQQPEYLRLISR